VRHEIPEAEVGLIGKVLLTFMIKPVDGDPPVATPAEEATVERGEYLAVNVANCVGCHTARSMTDGSYTGPRFAGGMTMSLDEDPTRGFVTPNLTPDPETGRVASWTEDQFVARFRAGKQYDESHMPWMAYMRMSDTDLRAIYRFLNTLEPVVSETPIGIVALEE